jgi:hypothetical protein
MLYDPKAIGNKKKTIKPSVFKRLKQIKEHLFLKKEKK